MKNRPSCYILLMIFVSACSTAKPTEETVSRKPNILLIAIDDLRPELNCYGADHIISPNIDELAAEGVLFTRAYTQQAVCAPSRNTLMTGIRPDGLGIWDLSTFFRDKAPDVTTLPQYFMEHGYKAEGMGKIYHTGHGNKDDTLSWSRQLWTPSRMVNHREPVESGDTTGLQTCYPTIDGKKLAWLNSSMPEPMHDDALVARHAIERLGALKDSSFFLAVGFRKPHLPFVAPRKYWEMYDQEKITVPPKDKPGVPSYAFANSGELRNYYDMPVNGYLTDEASKNLIHGYYACASFIDAQIGLLIQELKRLDLYENTIIILWGDHGWKLGDYGEWCKHTNYEIDTRIPVIIRLPGQADHGGWKSDAIIETVDLYPTLCELADLDLPPHLQGTSFKTALFDRDFDWDDVAFSQYPRSFNSDNGRVAVMGTSMRTAEYRITRWVNRETGETLASELYDHSGNALEMDNLAGKEAYMEFLLLANELFDREYEREHRVNVR